MMMQRMIAEMVLFKWFNGYFITNSKISKTGGMRFYCNTSWRCWHIEQAPGSGKLHVCHPVTLVDPNYSYVKIHEQHVNSRIDPAFGWIAKDNC